MAGQRSRKHEAERKAVQDYNGTGAHRVNGKTIKKEQSYQNRYGNGSYSDDDPRKTRKMKAMWVILLLIIAGGCIFAAYKYCQNKAAEAIADEAPRIERTTTPATTPAVKATPTKPEPEKAKVEEIVEEPKPQPQRSEYEDKFWSHLNDPRWKGSKDPANMSVDEVCEYTNFVADNFGY